MHTESICFISHRKHGNGWVACGEKSYKFSPNLTELLFNGPAEIAEIAESRVTGIGICPKNENTTLIPLSFQLQFLQLSDMLF